MHFIFAFFIYSDFDLRFCFQNHFLFPKIYLHWRIYIFFWEKESSDKNCTIFQRGVDGGHLSILRNFIFLDHLPVIGSWG